MLALPDEYSGEFCELLGMEKDKQQQLIDDHFLFKEGDRFLQSANASRFWPVGRAIFYNATKTFLVWVNEEDHMRIISMEEHGNLGNVYKRLVNAVDEISQKLKFARSDRFGFLTFCPTNLGTTIRASVHIKLPLLSKDLAKMEAEAANFNLQVRGSAGEHSEAVGGIYDISNKRRLGLTEFEAVTEMNEGIAKLIALEKELQG